MLHWHDVGHFDPRDRLDKSSKPYKPKLIRPIPEEAVDRCLAAFGEDVSEFVSYESGGYVLCDWSAAPFPLWDRVHRFADALADTEGAVVMSEDFAVMYPAEARKAWHKECDARKGLKVEG
jgi:hypothetical protein